VLDEVELSSTVLFVAVRARVLLLVLPLLLHGRVAFLSWALRRMFPRALGAGLI
jgi:hypothetical protein